MKTEPQIKAQTWEPLNALKSKVYLTPLILLLCGNFIIAQNDYTVMFYNVENLFDIYDDPTKNDNDFLPEGYKKWDHYKYTDKLSKLSKVILMAGKWSPPEIIGLAEIENRKVLKDLITKTPLAKYNYKIIHFESPDVRGIDCALLYRSDRIEKISSTPINITHPNSTLITRDILYSRLKINSDTLHVFVNHWSSRRGGRLKSEPKRILAADILRQKVDSVFNTNSKAKIVIAGDFNDEPSDKSLYNHLKAKPDSSYYYCNDNLINLSYNAFLNSPVKTLTYSGEWFLFDQIIVSHTLINKNDRSLYMQEFEIIQPDFLFTPERNNRMKVPRRSYRGPVYLWGFSDHLPVTAKIITK